MVAFFHWCIRGSALLSPFSDRIVHFACGHVIPDENILPAVLTKGPTGKSLDFSFQFRDQKETLDELGRALVRNYNCLQILSRYVK